MPDGIKRQILVQTRGGVDGNAFWRTGRRARQFTLRSRVDLPTFAHGFLLYGMYAQLIGEDPVPLVYSGSDLSEFGILVEVVDVRMAEHFGTVSGTGGINPPSLAFLECDWDLVAVRADLVDD